LLERVIILPEDLEERVRQLEVRIAMVETNISTMAQDIKDIKNTLQWLNRLVLGAIITAGIGLILVSGGGM
jgi:chaperonin cofactor prefoldin